MVENAQVNPTTEATDGSDGKWGTKNRNEPVTHANGSRFRSISVEVFRSSQQTATNAHLDVLLKKWKMNR
ncbi:MAG: hypothetical protein LBF88_04065 [Planctomycetaceae bacterium]|jgi:hypothetical protein|nr:hypothetical protein [Planctomycetaceae bacterium]